MGRYPLGTAPGPVYTVGVDKDGVSNWRCPGGI